MDAEAIRELTGKVLDARCEWCKKTAGWLISILVGHQEPGSHFLMVFKSKPRR